MENNVNSRNHLKGKGKYKELFIYPLEEKGHSKFNTKEINQYEKD